MTTGTLQPIHPSLFTQTAYPGDGINPSSILHGFSTNLKVGTVHPFRSMPYPFFPSRRGCDPWASRLTHRMCPSRGWVLSRILGQKRDSRCGVIDIKVFDSWTDRRESHMRTNADMVQNLQPSPTPNRGKLAHSFLIIPTPTRARKFVPCVTVRR